MEKPHPDILKEILLNFLIVFMNKKYPEQAKKLSIQEANDFIDYYYIKMFEKNK